MKAIAFGGVEQRDPAVDGRAPIASFFSVAGPRPKLRPMQPRPRAETYGPRVPSLRVLMVSSPVFCCLWLTSVLLVGHVLHPVDALAVELFLNGDVSHGSGRRRPVPVPFAWREPDGITGLDRLDGAALTLSPAAAGSDDQRLPERMGMPGRPRAGLEGDACARPCRVVRREQRINARRARDEPREPPARQLRAALLGLHPRLLQLFPGRWPRAMSDE